VVGVSNLESSGGRGQDALVGGRLDRFVGDHGMDSDLSLGHEVVRCEGVEDVDINILSVTDDHHEVAAAGGKGSFVEVGNLAVEAADHCHDSPATSPPDTKLRPPGYLIHGVIQPRISGRPILIRFRAS